MRQVAVPACPCASANTTRMHQYSMAAAKLASRHAMLPRLVALPIMPAESAKETAAKKPEKKSAYVQAMEAHRAQSCDTAGSDRPLVK